MRDWVLGTPEGDWVSMSVPSDGSYGVPEGIISSYPCTTVAGSYEIVQGLQINDFSRGKIDASTAELVEEREAVESPRSDLTRATRPVDGIFVEYPRRSIRSRLAGSEARPDPPTGQT